MKKVLLFFLLIIISSCCNTSDRVARNEYGLKGNVKQISQYAFLKNDSLTQDLDNDTISIKKSYFNQNGKIEKIIIQYTFNGESVISDFMYDQKSNLINEIVKSYDDSSFEVNYYNDYKDSLIISTNSTAMVDSLVFKNKTIYEYNSKDILKRSEVSRIHFDLETNDTIGNSVEIYNYDSNGYLKKARVKYLDSLDKSEKYIYKRNCEGLLLSTKSYKSNKLISKFINEYSFDEMDNWIEMKVFQKDTLRKIFSREIVYK